MLGLATLGIARKAAFVNIADEPPCEFPPLFRMERARLLEILGSLAASDWNRPTSCPGWSVLGLAAHLVGGDFSLLAGQRDGHLGTRAPAVTSEAELIGWLDELQIEWVHAARRLSPRLVTELLAWTDSQISDLIASQDPSAVTANVSWASARSEPVCDHWNVQVAGGQSVRAPRHLSGIGDR